MEKLAGVAGGSILEVKEALYQLLKSRPTPFKPDVDERLPYHAFKPMYDQGKLMLFVDRGLASVAGATGIVKSSAPLYVGASLITALAALPIWYFLSFLYALGVLVVAIILFKRSTAVKDVYRWLLSRKIIWTRQV